MTDRAALVRALRRALKGAEAPVYFLPFELEQLGAPPLYVQAMIGEREHAGLLLTSRRRGWRAFLVRGVWLFARARSRAPQLL